MEATSADCKVCSQCAYRRQFDCGVRSRSGVLCWCYLFDTRPANLTDGLCMAFQKQAHASKTTQAFKR